MGDVVEIGDWKFSRKPDFRYKISGECAHSNLVLNDKGQTVQCSDCKVYLSPYWALGAIIDQYALASARLSAEKAKLTEETKEKHLLIATRKVDSAWRSMTMVPACPNCHRGIFPSDGFGSSLVNKKIELARREAENRRGKS